MKQEQNTTLSNEFLVWQYVLTSPVLWGYAQLEAQYGQAAALAYKPETDTQKGDFLEAAGYGRSLPMKQIRILRRCVTARCAIARLKTVTTTQVEDALRLEFKTHTAARQAYHIWNQWTSDLPLTDIRPLIATMRSY